MANQETERLLIEIEVDGDKALQEATATAEAIRKVRAETAKLKKEQEELRMVGKTSSEVYKKNADLIQLNEAELKNLSSELRNSQKVLQANQNTTEGTTGAYQRLSQQYSVAAQRAKDLAVVHGTNSVEAKKATDAAKTMSDRLKEVDSSVGQNQRNVGNYNSVLDGLNSKFGSSISMMQGVAGAGGSVNAGMQTAAGGAKAFGAQLLKLLANPVVAILAGIAVVILLVVGTFKKMMEVIKGNEEQSVRLNKVLAPMNALGDMITRVFEKMADVFLDVAESTMKVVGAILDFLGVSKEVNQSTKEYMQLEKDKMALQDLSRKTLLNLAEGELEVSELKANIMRKDLYNAEQRRAMNDKAITIERKNADERKKIAVETLRIMEEEGARTKNSAKFNDDLVQAKIAVINAEKEYNDNIRRLSSQKSKFEDEIAADEKKKREDAIKKREDAEKAAAERRQKAQESELKKMDLALQLYQATVNETTERGLVDQMQTEFAIIDKKVAYNKLTSEESVLARLAIEKKYGDQLIVLANENLAKLRAANTAQLITEEEDYTDSIKLRLEGFQADFDNRYAIAEGNLNAEFEMEQAHRDRMKAAELLDAEKTGADKLLIEQKYAKLERDLEVQKIQAKLALTSGFLGNIKGLFKEGSKAAKGVASAQVAVDTIAGSIAAFKSMAGIPLVGPILGAAAAAGVAVSGAKAIKDIWKVKDEGVGSVSNPVSGGSVVSVSPQSVTGSLVQRSTQATQASQVQNGVSNALTDTPVQQVLVIDNVTDAIARKNEAKVVNSL